MARKDKAVCIFMPGMLVLAMKVFGQAVIATAQKFKFSPMLISADDRLSQTASVR
jgi:hypothetical protein